MYTSSRFVYALHSPTISALKFGRTSRDVRHRINHFRSQLQIHLDLIVVVEPNNLGEAQRLEEAIHKWLLGRSIKLRASTKTKEWYTDSDECALQVLAFLEREKVNPTAQSNALSSWKPYDFSYGSGYVLNQSSGL